MPFVPVTAIKLFGFFLFNFDANSASSFLGFLFLRYKTFSYNLSFLYFSETIILDPLLIASLINLFPSTLFPFIAIKMKSFFTSFELKDIPLNFILEYSLFKFG